MTAFSLVRYGAIPEVARFDSTDIGRVDRGDNVVVQSHRGVQLGTLLESTRTSDEDQEHNDQETDFRVLRRATPADVRTHRELQHECNGDFVRWQQRIDDWKLELELIDMEWTLERDKLILYVINDRGPDCTRLAIQAAAAGLGIIEVQPVDISGLVTSPAGGGGGCGSGGCGSGGCS